MAELNFNNPHAFKVENFHLTPNPAGLIIDSLAILLGNYEIHRKQAALLILKILVRADFLKELLSDGGIYPFSRNDPRVRLWVKNILSIGKCQICDSKEQLEAHHIIRWADYPAGRIDLNNGMCLCKACHIEAHRYDDKRFMEKGA